MTLLQATVSWSVPLGVNREIASLLLLSETFPSSPRGETPPFWLTVELLASTKYSPGIIQSSSGRTRLFPLTSCSVQQRRSTAAGPSLNSSIHSPSPSPTASGSAITSLKKMRVSAGAPDARQPDAAGVSVAVGSVVRGGVAVGVNEGVAEPGAIVAVVTGVGVSTAGA